MLPEITAFDKGAHVVAYGVLAAAFLYALHPIIHREDRLIAAVIVVLFCFLYGISDEFHQSFIPGRYVSGWDVAADGLGALLVAGFWYWKVGADPNANVLDNT